MMMGMRTDAPTANAGGAPALVDDGELRAMVRHVGAEATREFVNRFVSLWPSRLERLMEAVVQGDCETFRDASLSLKSGASMAGATALAALGDRLHRIASDPDAPDACARAREAMADLERLGGLSVEALAALAAVLCADQPA